MFNIVPPLLIILGIVGLILLLSNKKAVQKTQTATETILPKDEENTNTKKTIIVIKWSRLFNKQAIKQNIDVARYQSVKFFEKLLIRFRIIILRVDHLLLKGQKKLKAQKEISEGEKSFSEPGQQNKQNNFPDISILAETTMDLKIQEPENIAPAELAEHEKKLLKDLSRNHNFDSLINLARLYLFRQDFSSARWVLLEAHRLDQENIVVKDLLIELKEKENIIQPE